MFIDHVGGGGFAVVVFNGECVLVSWGPLRSAVSDG
jgi:hypothetical protein